MRHLGKVRGVMGAGTRRVDLSEELDTERVKARGYVYILLVKGPGNEWTVRTKGVIPLATYRYRRGIFTTAPEKDVLV